MAASTLTPHGTAFPEEGRCGYFVEKKKRFCRMVVAAGKRFCGEHAGASEGESRSEVQCFLLFKKKSNQRKNPRNSLKYTFCCILRGPADIP
ncbi:hypothetical protein FD755_000057 [Muntiacus reevesi]|uniref:Zinc finger CCCH-type TRM13 domain-containing protein n=1 Tax=Muntiacus reevesi TaxID=9886 RepID=A0A5J5MXS4_MUNRE|nr:hypothetical protein FD755_000057 [Muntiacus reevesi]